MDVILQYKFASRLTKSAHGDQKYGEHDYFEYHVMGVVNRCAKRYDYLLDTDAELYWKILIVAVCHDLLEDTSITTQHLQEYLDDDIIQAIVAINQKDGEEWYDYMMRIAFNDIAYMVKLEDQIFNLEQCIKEGNNSRARYYNRRISDLLHIEKAQ